jgi:hypothetical protein
MCLRHMGFRPTKGTKFGGGGYDWDTSIGFVFDPLVRAKYTSKRSRNCALPETRSGSLVLAGAAARAGTDVAAGLAAIPTPDNAISRETGGVRAIDAAAARAAPEGGELLWTPFPGLAPAPGLAGDAAEMWALPSVVGGHAGDKEALITPRGGMSASALSLDAPLLVGPPPPLPTLPHTRPPTVPLLTPCPPRSAPSSRRCRRRPPTSRRRRRGAACAHCRRGIAQHPRRRRRARRGKRWATPWRAGCERSAGRCAAGRVGPAAAAARRGERLRRVLACCGLGHPPPLPPSLPY